MVPKRKKQLCKKLRTQITRYEKSLILQAFMEHFARKYAEI